MIAAKAIFYTFISIGLKPKPVKLYKAIQPKKCPLSCIVGKVIYSNEL
jgi:hypothetical protein